MPKKLANFLISQISYGGGLFVAHFALSSLIEIGATSPIFAGLPGGFEAGLDPWLFLVRCAIAVWFIVFSLRLFFGIRSCRLLMD